MDYSFILMMEDEFSITRKSRISDGIGGYIVTENQIIPSHNMGRLDDENYSEVLRVGQDVVYITHRMFCYPNEDIQRDDTIQIKGRTLRVIFTRTEYEEHPMEILCQEIDP